MYSCFFHFYGSTSCCIAVLDDQVGKLKVTEQCSGGCMFRGVFVFQGKCSMKATTCTYSMYVKLTAVQDSRFLSLFKLVTDGVTNSVGTSSRAKIAKLLFQLVSFCSPSPSYACINVSCCLALLARYYSFISPYSYHHEVCSPCLFGWLCVSLLFFHGVRSMGGLVAV